MNVWSLSLPFFLLASGLAVGLTRWTPRRMPGGRDGGASITRTSTVHRMALAALTLLPWALAWAVAWTLEKTALHSVTRTTAFYAAVVATVAPQLLLHSCLAWALFRRGFFTAASAPRDRVRTGARVAMVVVVLAAVSFMILFLVLSPDVEAYAPVAAAFILAIVAIVTAGRTAALADQGHPTEMEDSPLRREIESIASAFGWAPRAIRVYQVRRADVRPGESEILQGLDQWRMDFNPFRPALPAELLQEADHAAISAGMAMRYAHAILLNPFHLPALRLGPLRLSGAFVAALLLGAGGTALFLLLMSLGETPGDAAMLAYWFVVLFGFIAALVAIQIRRRRYHVYAFRAWKAAASARQRTLEDFVAALACYDRAMKHADPEKILARYRRDISLNHFLRREGADPDLAFTRAREALTATTQPAAGGHL